MMIDILTLIGSLLPALLVLFVVGYIIYVGTKHSNYSKSTKRFTTIFYVAFSLALIAATVISSYGNDKASIIAFSVVGGLILLPIVLALIFPSFSKEPEGNTNSIVAKLVDYTPALTTEENNEELKDKYNAVFMHIANETTYYTSYETFSEAELKDILNTYVEIDIDNDRCKIIGNLTKTFKRRKEKEKDAISAIQFAVYLIERIPVIIGLIIIDIIVFSKLDFIWWCLLVLVTLLVTYDFIKKAIVFINFNKYIKNK